MFTAFVVFTKSISHLCNQVTKACIKLRQLNLKSLVLTNLRSSFKTFQCTGYSNSRIRREDVGSFKWINIYSICDKLASECPVLKICKHVLSVNCKSNNAAVREELGFYLVLIHTAKSVISYWQRFNCLKLSSFPYRIFVKMNSKNSGYRIPHGFTLCRCYS